MQRAHQVECVRNVKGGVSVIVSGGREVCGGRVLVGGEGGVGISTTMQKIHTANEQLTSTGGDGDGAGGYGTAVASR